jgi:hypothetical protein
MTTQLEVVRAELKRLADAAYCAGVDQLNADLCKGTVWRIENGKFGIDSLHQFCRAHEDIGRHRAFHEALKLLESAVEHGGKP